jgi:adenine-specific DNA-methyltransferase
MAKKTSTKTIETIRHDTDKRKNIPTAEFQSILKNEEQKTLEIRYPRNTDLDPQLLWRGKDEQDWSDLVIQTPPIYIQEKVHPKVLIDDLLRQTKDAKSQEPGFQTDLFSDFNGITEGADKTEFYQHDQNWTNRMILGDSLQVMASLAEREGLRGKVQCVYFDPPYGIKFNSNFQWSTTDKAGTTTDSSDKISREPEQVKAFRDTWRDGIHSYLTYIRDRLTISRDLLSDTGSIFVQIGDENVHRVRAVMDEIFGEDNFVALIPFRKKTMPFGSKFIEQMADFILWYAKNKTDSKGNANAKYRKQFSLRSVEGEFHYCWYENSEGLRTRMSKHQLYNHALLPPKSRVFRLKSLEPSGRMDSGMFDHEFRGKLYYHPKNGFGTTPNGLKQVERSNRLEPEGNRLCYVLYAEEGESSQLTAPWSDTVGADDKQYVVQTNTEVVKRCILMTTDPGDLIIDPTCGSGTTAYVAEHWGRRWITIDTSRVALALARSRIMGARYPYYFLADSREGQIKEAEITHSSPSSQPVQLNIRHGFVYERMPRITLGSIANNSWIDIIWNKWQQTLTPIAQALNDECSIVKDRSLDEWEIPYKANPTWSEKAKKLHSDWWQSRFARQKEIDLSIASNADSTYIFDKPYEDKKKVRVAGPFTVESLSPHRMIGIDENDELIDSLAEKKIGYGVKKDFAQMILENLKTSGVQQAHKDDRITFTALTAWPGDLVCAEGRYLEGIIEKRAAIFVGPEFGTVQRADLVSAAREAGDADFDALIACAFNYEAHTTEFTKLGRIPVLKARMNADLHMAENLKNTGKGNLFIVFGEPDIELLYEESGWLRIKVNGVDVFKPQTGEVISDGADGIACWFIDTDYNEESFFVRHAYFLGANDPYDSLKITLKAEINKEAWESLHSDISRPFDKPKNGRIAVKVINHLGDEVMKVFKI